MAFMCRCQRVCVDVSDLPETLFMPSCKLMHSDATKSTSTIVGGEARMRISQVIFTTVALLGTGCQGGIALEGALPRDMAQGTDASIVVDGALKIAVGPDELVVDRARMSLGELEIEGRTEASEFEVGPSVLELGLDGEPTEIAISDVPAGTYQEIGFELSRGAAASDEFGGSDPASIIVDGTHNGKPFSYRSRYAAELEFDLGDLRVKDGQVASVTITFDVAAWFLDSNDQIIDPSGPDARKLIDANIHDSVEAYAEEEDDDD